MGGETFGEIDHVRGIITYRVSPYELNPFAGLLTKSPYNMFRRIRSEIFFILPPAMLAYAIYDWGITTHAKSKRKNPKDYENDV